MIKLGPICSITNFLCKARMYCYTLSTKIINLINSPHFQKVHESPILEKIDTKCDKVQ